MIKLHLYGFLRETFGTGFEISAKSPAEAVRIMEANFPGRFAKAFATGGFYVVRGKDLENCKGDTERTLAFELDDDIHIIPEIVGSTNFFRTGWGKVVIGVIIIAAAYYGAYLASAEAAAGGASAEAAAAAGSASTWMGISMSSYTLFGASLVLSGVSQMLSPTPDAQKVNDGKSTKSSFIFGGAENIVGQGTPVPLVYGEIETGSVTIAVSLTIEDLDIGE